MSHEKLVVVFLSLCIASIKTQNTKNGTNEDRKILIVSTADAKLTAIDIQEQGKILWIIEHAHLPLISTSKSSLDFIENGRIVRLIPSLQRTLFKCYGNSLEALPFDATQPNFRLTNSTFLTNNNEICYTTVDAFTGKLAQSCRGSFCKQRNALFSENNRPKLLLKRVQQTVQAIVNTSFEKKWRYSVGDLSNSIEA